MDGNTNMIKLNIIQWNSQSLRPKLISLEHILYHEKIHIAALSETWMESESELKVSGYNIFRKDRYDSYGGVAILVHKSVKASLYRVGTINTGIEIVMVKIHNCEHIKYIASVYCAPTVNTTQTDWEQLFNIMDNKCMILGDFNGHHTDWSHKIDSRGSQIYDALSECKFITLNDSRSPTRVRLVNNVLQLSSPDISLVSSDIALRFNWGTINECLGSDHKIIKIDTHMNYNSNFKILRRNYKLADWKSYKKSLESMFNDLKYHSENPQQLYDSFVNCINIAADQYIPKLKLCNNPSSKFSSKAYWQPTLSRLVAERRLALATFRRNPTPQNLNILKIKIRDTQKTIRQAKINHGGTSVLL